MKKLHSLFLVFTLSIFVSIQAQTKLISSNLIGSTTSWGNNDPVDLNKVFDGDFTTFLDLNDNWGFIGYDFGAAGSVVDVLKYAPRAGWANRMNGAILRGSNSSNFLNEFDVLYIIPEVPTEGVLTEGIVAAQKAYRYVYLFMSAGTYLNISEFEFYDVNSNKLTGTLIGPDLGSEWCDTCTPDKGIDGNFDTYVEAPKTIGFVGYDFGEGTETRVTSWKYAPRSGYANRLNGSILCGSNSPNYLSDYTVLSTITSDPIVGVLTEQTISDANKYRYIFWKGGVNSYGNISELELYFQTEPALSVSKNEIVLDTYYSAESVYLSSSNLTENITVNKPAGITVEPAIIPVNKETEIYIFWDSITPVDGDIIFSSGTGKDTIKIKCVDDSQCYTPYSTEEMNFVFDPGINSFANFAGWGQKALVNVIHQPELVYCGASSATVGDSVNHCAGSLDVNLTGAFEPNSTYLVRAMIKTLGGSFQLGVWGWSEGQADKNYEIDTEGEWQQVEFTFTTGDIISSNCGMFVNNCGNTTGLLAFVDNWELYQMFPTALSNPELNEAKVFIQNRKIVLEYFNDFATDDKITIFNLSGTVIFNETFNSIIGKNYKIIDLELSAGVYLVKVKINNRISVIKLIR